MVTKDIISKAHTAFRNVNPDIWTDLSVYIAQVEYEVVDLKRQLAEANDKARLQRAIDRIEAAGWKVDSILFPTISDEDTSCTIHRVGAFAYMPKMFRGETPTEAAEAAAAWCEQHKEAAHERD